MKDTKGLSPHLKKKEEEEEDIRLGTWPSQRSLWISPSLSYPLSRNLSPLPLLFTTQLRREAPAVTTDPLARPSLSLPLRHSLPLFPAISPSISLSLIIMNTSDQSRLPSSTTFRLHEPPVRNKRRPKMGKVAP